MKNITGKNLKKWREKLGYSQEKIAEYLGIARENVSFFETGEREIPVSHLEKIAYLYGIEPETLFNEDETYQEAELSFAFRNAEELSKESLENIARFQKIVRNYLIMEKKLG